MTCNYVRQLGMKLTRLFKGLGMVADPTSHPTFKGQHQYTSDPNHSHIHRILNQKNLDLD